jgi:hypothetical protein
MSVESAVTEGLATPLDQNAQAAEEAKKMLAELEGDAAPAEKPEETNGVKKADAAAEDGQNGTDAAKREESNTTPEDDGDAEDEARERRQDRRYDDRPDRNRNRREFQDRRGGRGGGGGRRDDYKPRNYRDNIKSDLTTLEVTDDPVAIRKQV